MRAVPPWQESRTRCSKISRIVLSACLNAPFFALTQQHALMALGDEDSVCSR